MSDSFYDMIKAQTKNVSFQCELSTGSIAFVLHDVS